MSKRKGTKQPGKARRLNSTERNQKHCDKCLTTTSKPETVVIDMPYSGNTVLGRKIDVEVMMEAWVCPKCGEYQLEKASLPLDPDAALIRQMFGKEVDLEDAVAWLNDNHITPEDLQALTSRPMEEVVGWFKEKGITPEIVFDGVSSLTDLPLEWLNDEGVPYRTGDKPDREHS